MKKVSWLNVLALLAWSVPIVASLFTLTGFLGRWNWLLDLTSHFRLLYLVILLVAVPVALGRRRHLAAAGFAVCLLVNAWLVVPYFLPQSTVRHTQAFTAIRLVQMNAWASNRHCDRASSLILKNGPDIVAVEEYTVHCGLSFLRSGVFRRYPYHVEEKRSRLLLLSRTPLQYTISNPPGRNPAIIIGHTRIRGQAVTIMVTHPDRPNQENGRVYREQIQQFERLGHLVRAQIRASNHPIIVLGDLNATPWSYPFRRLLAQSGLRDTQRGFGVLPTYPIYFPRSQFPFVPLIPIDHVLVSRGVVTLNRIAGPNTGSDHLPVIVDVGIPGS